jgi:hypothetical protein
MLCLAFLRRYHPWQFALVSVCLALFVVGCRLLALQQSVSPDILTRKIQGNLELSFDRYSRMPSTLLGFAIVLLLLPFVGTAGVAVRHRRTVLLYAVLAFGLLAAIASTAVYLTVQLAAAESNCAQVSACYQCDAKVLPTKCRTLSRFAMKTVSRCLLRTTPPLTRSQCFVYSDTLGFVCTQLASVAFSTVLWLYIALVVAILNFAFAVKAVRARNATKTASPRLNLRTTARALPASLSDRIHRLLRLKPSSNRRRRQRARRRARATGAFPKGQQSRHPTPGRLRLVSAVVDRHPSCAAASGRQPPPRRL